MKRTNVVKDWLVSHPRITIPLLAAIFAGITYAVFDPIRIFFVTSKVTQRFNPQEYAFYRWLRKETWDRLIQPDSIQQSTQSSPWADDFEHTEKLRAWLAESPGRMQIPCTHIFILTICNRNIHCGHWK